MARDAALDLEAPGAPSRSAAPSTSAIVLERSGSGRPSLAFLAGVTLLAGAVIAVAWTLGAQGDETPAETAARPLVAGLADVGLGTGRAVSAIAAGATVAAVAFAGRSFTRSGIAGLLTGALVGLDPSLLAYGRLALPTALTLAFLAGALAAMASSRAWGPWAGAILLAAAAFTDPRTLYWGPPLALFLLMRGHIYASPRHLGLAATQALAIPFLGALLHVTADGMWASVPACLAPPAWALLTLRAAVVPGPEVVAMPNPVTWLAGLGAVLFLGVGAVVFAGSRFRLARANGRMQVRLASPFPAVLGRGGWLLLLALLVPIPQAWLLLFALALALGVQDLGEDAPGFGLTLAIVLLAFAAVVLWRSWDGISGVGGVEGVEAALRLVPWAKSAPC